MDNTWEITQIVNNFNRAVKEVDEYSDEREALEELYAQALRVQCKEDCGYVMVLEDFLEDVASGFFTSYDGHGYFLDFEGNRHEYVRCDIDFLEKRSEEEEYPFVLWFNK